MPTSSTSHSSAKTRIWYWPMWPAPTTPARIRFSARLGIGLLDPPAPGTRQDSPLRFLHELDEVPHVLGGSQLLPEAGHGSSGREPGAIEQLVGTLKEEAVRRGDARAAQAHHVDSPNDSRIPLDQ